VFHGKRNPVEMGEPEVTRFLSALATEGRVGASTQNQALAAILFLYRVVLGRELAWMDDVVRAKRPVRVPVVLSRDEVRSGLAGLSGSPLLVVALLYGAGLRVLEALRLRWKDVDFDRGQLVVREGKGDRDRVTMLPEGVRSPLRAHLGRVRRQHRDDLRRGAGWVELPLALGRKYPRAGREPGWQWVFPATRFYTHRETGERRRHHRHPSPRISSRTATISGPSRSSSATATSARPWSTRTSYVAALPACGARWTRCSTRKPPWSPAPYTDPAVCTIRIPPPASIHRKRRDSGDVP
jgi:integrase